MQKDNPLRQQFEDVERWTRLVARTDAKAARFVCMAVSGPGGLGKTHVVTRTLKAMGVRHRLARGTTAALLRTAYEFRHGGVLVLDDADNLILGGTTAMNFMKQLLLPEPTRLIVNDSVLARRNARREDSDPTIPPPSFTVKCSVIWITNIDLHDPTQVPKTARAHLQPLIDRGLNPLRLSSDPQHIADYVLSLATETNLLKANGYSLDESRDAVAYFCHNVWRLPSISVRSMLKIADVRATEPDVWQGVLDRWLERDPISDAPPLEVPLIGPSQIVLAAPPEAVVPPQQAVMAERPKPPAAPRKRPAPRPSGDAAASAEARAAT
jgi:hypothetical protein